MGMRAATRAGRTMHGGRTRTTGRSPGRRRAVRGALAAAWLVLVLVAPRPARAAAAPAATPDVPAPGVPAPVLAAVGRGLAALARDDFEGALAHFDAAVAAAPEHASAWHGRGAALARLGRHDAARDALKRALELSPDGYEIRLDLAVEYLAVGNRVWATRVLTPPPPPDASGAPFALAARRDALLGLALVEQGRDEDALALLDPPGGVPAPRTEEDADPAALRALVVGRARLVGGRVHEALGAFAAVDPHTLDPHLRAAADDLLAIALEADNPEPGWVSASAAAGVEYDSNALYDPDLPEAHGDSPAAGRTFVRAAVSLRPWNTGAHRLAGDAGFFRSFHFGNEDARQLDLTEVTGTVRYAHRFVRGTVDHTVQIRYLFALDLLEGGALLPDPERFVFLESHGAEAGWTLRPADWLETRVTYTLQRRLFAEMARDAWLNQLALGQTILLADGRLRLGVDLSGRIDTAERPRYDLGGALVGVRVAGRVPWGLELYARASYTHLRHPNSAGRFDAARPDTVRTDRVVDVAGGLGRTFLDGHLTAALQYRYNLHASTIPVFDYERHLVTLVLGGKL